MRFSQSLKLAAALGLPIPTIGLVSKIMGLKFGVLFLLILPGEVANLFIFGVHGTWKEPAASIIAFALSYILYSIAALTLISLFVTAKGKR